jgi:hypothetical protein
MAMLDRVRDAACWPSRPQGWSTMHDDHQQDVMMELAPDQGEGSDRGLGRLASGEDVGASRMRSTAMHSTRTGPRSEHDHDPVDDHPALRVASAGLRTSKRRPQGRLVVCAPWKLAQSAGRLRVLHVGSSV